jgi:hypothetical protein
VTTTSYCRLLRSNTTKEEDNKNGLHLFSFFFNLIRRRQQPLSSSSSSQAERRKSCRFLRNKTPTKEDDGTLLSFSSSQIEKKR